MSTYLATINVPGYLPMDDDPPTFETIGEAWEYLASERREAEDETEEQGDPYSETVDELDAYASAGALGSVYGSTPGYDGDHDLGLSYTVSVCEDDDTREGEE